MVKLHMLDHIKKEKKEIITKKEYRFVEEKIESDTHEK